MSELDRLIAELCPNGVEYVNLGSLIKRVNSKGKTNNSITTVYAISNIEGIIESSKYHVNKIHSKNTSQYNIIEPNMFAYNPARLNIGSIAYLKNDKIGLVSPMYVVFKIDKNKVIKELM